MTGMVERIARAIAFMEGSRMSGPGESRATREFGWKGDGVHFEQYAEAHWREYTGAAQAVLSALKTPTDIMFQSASRYMDSESSNGAWWEAMLEAAQNDVPVQC